MLRLEPATLAHIGKLAPLFNAYRQFYEQASDMYGADVYLRQRLANGESVVWIAFWDEQPAGFTQLYPMWSSVSMRRVWVLNDLFVHPDFRQKGIATALMEAAKQYAMETGAKGLVLETGVTNVAAQALYEKQGWKKETTAYTYFINI